MDRWILNYFSYVAELNRLLSLRFVWDGYGYASVGARTPIGESIKMVGIYHNKRDYIQRNIEIAKLAMLVKHLQTIEKHDKELLKEFKRKLHDSRNHLGTYFGIRMEIHIAASLIQKGINFVKTESPDFTVDEYGVHLECTSAHTLDDGSVNLTDKIRSTILLKSKKVYCNPSIVLCIDITNILAASIKNENELLTQMDGLKRAVKQILTDTNSSYGSLLMFSYFMDLKGIFRSGYVRIDNENAIPTLIGFLDKYFPICGFWTGAGWAPWAG